MIWRRTQPREHQLAEGLSRHVFDGEASQQLTMANAHILCHCRVSGQSLYRGVVAGGGVSMSVDLNVLRLFGAWAHRAEQK